MAEKLASFPTTCGVYLMKDRGGRIIYVGKAANLRQRVRSYFGGRDSRAQVRFLINRLADIDFLQTHNEKEALLLENSLIKKHKPRYNVFLKDDKTYQGMKLTMAHDFPRLVTTRKVKKDGSIYYGPFTSADVLYQVKEFIDQYFQLRTCSDREFSLRTRPCLEYQIKRCSAPCVNYVSRQDYARQVESVRLFLEGKSKSLQCLVEQRMREASDREKFEEAARLRDLLRSMASVLEAQKVTHLSFDFVDVMAIKRFGDKRGVAVLMIRESRLIDSRYYVFKSLEDDQGFLNHFITQYYTENSFIPRRIFVPLKLDDVALLEDMLAEKCGSKVTLHVAARGEMRSLLDLAQQNLASHVLKTSESEKNIVLILENFKKHLHLLRLPRRIECYDVSNISGQHATASLVVFVDGQPHKDGYRRFRIRYAHGPDDFAMMEEVLTRRFQKREGGWSFPDLVVLDGGKGQLGRAVRVFHDLGVMGVDVVGIAKGRGPGARARGLWKGKKEEEIYIPGRKNPVELRRGSAEIMLFQKIRDEAHRFAIAYHRKLRQKNLDRSFLDEIPGIGKKRRNLLIQKFGSPHAVVQASLEDLMAVPGVTREMAVAVSKCFR